LSREIPTLGRDVKYWIAIQYSPNNK